MAADVVGQVQCSAAADAFDKAAYTAVTAQHMATAAAAPGSRPLTAQATQRQSGCTLYYAATYHNTPTVQHSVMVYWC
jgi:hypothetical protein